MSQNRVNRGKDFEGQVHDGFAKIEGVSIDRLPDPMAGYAGVRNICDFLVYKYPTQYYVECKSCYGNTLSIHSNDPKRKYGAITNNQWEGLLEKSKIPGVRAGVMIWFIDHDVTFWYDIRLLQACKDYGMKSIPWANSLCHNDQCRIIEGKKRRVLFDYDFIPFFKEINADGNY